MLGVIIFSTSQNDNEKRKTLSIGALDYIVKPSIYDQGLQMMERINQFITISQNKVSKDE